MSGIQELLRKDIMSVNRLRSYEVIKVNNNDRKSNACVSFRWCGVGSHLCNGRTIFNGKIINDLLLALTGTD